MTIMLNSILDMYYKDDDDNYHAIPLKDTNGVLSNIKKHISNSDRLVYVANDPSNHEKSDEKIQTFKDSFSLTGIPFKEYIALDDRNQSEASKILSTAGLIILSGGKCLIQNNFFNQINLKKILSQYKGLVIGISAGSMNLCDIVLNFPEETIDLGEPRWLKGMGFYSESIIPHFDGDRVAYEFPTELDCVNNYILPSSWERKLIAIPNQSYILIDGKNITYYGPTYEIFKGKVTKIN